VTIHELLPAQAPAVRPLFVGWQYNYRIDSALEGNSPCRIFVDNVDEPQVAMLWVHDTFCVAGATDVDDYNGGLDAFIDEVIRPAAVQWDLGYFAIQGHPGTEWPARLRELLGHRDLQVNNIHKYRFDPAT